MTVGSGDKTGRSPIARTNGCLDLYDIRKNHGALISENRISPTYWLNQFVSQFKGTIVMASNYFTQVAHRVW